MHSILLIIPIAAGAFLATNLDNFALLLTFLARYRQRMLVVASAYLIGISLLGGVAYAIGHVATIVPVEYIGLLGLAPVGLGVAGVFKLLSDAPGTGSIREQSPGGSRTAFLATLASQLGNGTDTIITFASLFADSDRVADTLIVLTFVAMMLIFLASAHYAIRHPAVEALLERYAHRITPFILIIVGTYILANTATDLMPG